MQENSSPPRVGRDGLVAHERGVLARMKEVRSKALVSVVEGDHVMIPSAISKSGNRFCVRSRSNYW